MDGQPSVSGSDEELVRWIRMVVRRAKWAGIAHAISPDVRFAILAALGFLRRSIGMGRDCPCHLTGRSLRPSWPSLTRRKPRFAILAALGFLRRSIGMGNPSSPYILERLL